MNQLTLKRLPIDTDVSETALNDLLVLAEEPCFHVITAPRLAFDAARLLQHLRKDRPNNLAEARYVMLDLIVVHAWDRPYWGVMGPNVIAYTEAF